MGINISALKNRQIFTIKTNGINFLILQKKIIFGSLVTAKVHISAIDLNDLHCQNS